MAFKMPHLICPDISMIAPVQISRYSAVQSTTKESVETGFVASLLSNVITHNHCRIKPRYLQKRLHESQGLAFTKIVQLTWTGA